MTAALQFFGDCNSERILKIVQYLKLCYLGFTFLDHPVDCISKTAADSD